MSDRREGRSDSQMNQYNDMKTMKRWMKPMQKICIMKWIYKWYSDDNEETEEWPVWRELSEKEEI